MPSLKIPFRILLLIILSLLVVSGCKNNESNPAGPNNDQTPSGQVDPFNQNKILGSGINIGNALEAPNEGDWGVIIKDEYFPTIKKAGFNSVRIPIKWSAHALSSSPYTINASFFSRIDHVINEALKSKLAIVINIHHYDEIMQDPENEKDRFVALWSQIAERYKNYSSDLFFELLNEPNGNLTPTIWNELIKVTVAKIRETNPYRTIILCPAEWSSISALNQLEIPQNENNVIVTFHYYNPFHFTHQGAEWVQGSDQWLGTKWTGTTQERTEIRNDFTQAADWGSQHNIPLNIGEFGAYSKADIYSRIAWTTFVSQSASGFSFSWHYWEFCSGFGIYDPVNNKFYDALLNSLIPPV